MFYVSKWVKCLVSVFGGIVISSLYSRHIYDDILEHMQWNQLMYASVIVWTHGNHLLNQIDRVHCGNCYGIKIVYSGKSTAMRSLNEDENILQPYPSWCTVEAIIWYSHQSWEVPHSEWWLVHYLL